MVSYFTYYGDTVSERMWQLWPGMVRAIKDWAVDYFENFLVPMDNFISKGTERFLAGTAPNYLEDTYALCHHLLADENIPDMDCKCAVQLLECVLLNCRGRVDQWVEPFLRTAGIRLAKRDTEPFLRDLLVGTYANAIYYNPQLALAALARLNATEALFTLWVQMLDKRTKEGGRTHFKREHDKKVNALALATLFTLPVGALPESVAQGMQSVLRVLLQLLGDLKEQRAARIKAQEEEEDEEAESEDGDSVRCNAARRRRLINSVSFAPPAQRPEKPTPPSQLAAPTDSPASSLPVALSGQLCRGRGRGGGGGQGCSGREAHRDGASILSLSLSSALRPSHGASVFSHRILIERALSVRLCRGTT